MYSKNLKGGCMTGGCMTKNKELVCCGFVINQMTTTKLSNQECTIAVYICEACGRVYSESKFPLFLGGKAVFCEKGDVVVR